MRFVGRIIFYPLNKFSLQRVEVFLPFATRKLIEQVDSKAHRFSLCFAIYLINLFSCCKGQRRLRLFSACKFAEWVENNTQQTASSLVKWPCARQVTGNYCSFYLVLNLCNKEIFAKFHLKTFAREVVFKF